MGLRLALLPGVRFSRRRTEISGVWPRERGCGAGAGSSATEWPVAPFLTMMGGRLGLPRGPGWSEAGALSLPLCCRQCALAALRDVKSYLTKEGGQIAVSPGNGQLCLVRRSRMGPWREGGVDTGQSSAQSHCRDPSNRARGPQHESLRSGWLELHRDPGR